MRHIDKIDIFIDKELSQFFKAKNFKEIDRVSQSMGACRTYQNGGITLRLLCNRGIIDIEVGPKSSTKKFRCIPMIKDIEEPAPKGRWNLSLEEQAKFLITNYKAISQNLREENYIRYFKKIDANY